MGSIRGGLSFGGIGWWEQQQLCLCNGKLWFAGTVNSQSVVVRKLWRPKNKKRKKQKKLQKSPQSYKKSDYSICTSASLKVGLKVYHNHWTSTMLLFIIILTNPTDVGTGIGNQSFFIFFFFSLPSKLLERGKIYTYYNIAQMSHKIRKLDT